MRTSDPYGADIKKLNYEAMILFREMVRCDKPDACLRLNLEPAAADVLADTTLEELGKIADTSILLFSARFGETRFWEDPSSSSRQTLRTALSAPQWLIPCITSRRGYTRTFSGESHKNAIGLNRHSKR